MDNLTLTQQFAIENAFARDHIKQLKDDIFKLNAKIDDQEQEIYRVQEENERLACDSEGVLGVIDTLKKVIENTGVIDFNQLSQIVEKENRWCLVCESDSTNCNNCARVSEAKPEQSSI